MSEDYYKTWWAKNSEKTLAERKARYHNDPEFRAKVQAGNRSYRQRLRMEKNNSEGTRPTKYMHDMRTAADILGVTVSSIRWWIQQQFLPQPFHHGGKFWFTKGQVGQLQQLADHLAEHPKTGRKSPAFAVVLDLIQFNWEN